VGVLTDAPVILRALEKEKHLVLLCNISSDLFGQSPSAIVQAVKTTAASWSKVAERRTIQDTSLGETGQLQIMD
jgi:hypothetical protein